MSDRDNYDARFDYKYPTSSKTSPNRKSAPDSYDGVEYIPSEQSPPRRPQRPAEGQNHGGYRQTKNSRGTGGFSGNGKKKMKPQSQSAMFMAIIVGVGVLICFGAFFLMFSLTKPSPVKVTDANAGITSGEMSGNTEADAEVPESPISDSALTGAIKTISNGTVSVVSAEDDSVYDIYINADTVLKDKYGQPVTLSRFSEGDIVMAEFNSINKKAQVFWLAPEGWIKSGVKNIEIDPATVSIKTGNESLSVSKNAVFLPEGTGAVVKPSDVVTLKGHKSKIMTIMVEKRSGTLEFKNKDRITDGTVEVDTDIYKALEEAGSLKISIGAHTVVIKGANIDAFIKEINVKEGETVVIDLAEAQVKEGIINLNVNEPDYTLSVNDEIIARSQEPIKLPFGSYKLRVSKDGFTSWEGNVTVNQPSVDVNVTLTAEVKMGKISITITEPAGLPGSVYIDNALIGTAPIYKANVTYGTHQLTIKAPGYIDTSTPIIVEGDMSYNVTMHLINDNSGITDNTGNINSDAGAGDTDINYVDPLIQ